MKKVISILLACVLLLGVLCCGCSDGTTADATINAANAGVTNAVENTSSALAESDDDYADNITVKGYTLEKLESVMSDCIQSNDWQKLNGYILPGAKKITDKMIATENEEAKYDYTYCLWYSTGSIKDYSDRFDELPSAEKISYEYLDLKTEDENYRESMYNALYPTLKYDHDDEDIENMTRSLSEMAESVFDEYRGGDMEYLDLKVMKVCAVDENEYGLDMFIYVFVIETDYGYFFLCG